MPEVQTWCGYPIYMQYAPAPHLDVPLAEEHLHCFLHDGQQASVVHSYTTAHQVTQTQDLQGGEGMCKRQQQQQQQQQQRVGVRAEVLQGVSGLGI